jgi:hypothetical protein
MRIEDVSQVAGHERLIQIAMRYANVNQTLTGAQSLSVEIYDTSFDPSMAHAGLLRSEIPSFAAGC